ncbi:MAG: hypothetical protein GY854_18235 [Deltaproteobacteria bacterium]|nr:hypothetical protein [Deltaproteobacteria bacterium]
MRNNKDKCVRPGQTVVFWAILAASVLVFSKNTHADQNEVNLGQGLYLGNAILAENLTVWPVYSKKPMPKIKGEFVTLADAQAKDEAVIREKGKPGRARRHPRRSVERNQMVQQRQVQEYESDGVVGELVIENKGQKPILVLAGTLLKGGKQDRQVGQDFIVPPKKTVSVSAFCVEHGRWNANRNGRATGGRFKAQKSLATKSVRGSGQYKGNQSEVWANVAKENKKAGKAPSSGTLMAAVEDTSKKSKTRRARISKVISNKFAKLASNQTKPVGLAYAVDGQVREVRSFTHPSIFDRFRDTLLTTVVIEADLAQSEAEALKRPVHTKPAKAAEVADLVSGANKIKGKKVKTKAGNVNRTRKSEKVMNADCFEDEVAAEPVTSSYMFAE